MSMDEPQNLRKDNKTHIMTVRLKGLEYDYVKGIAEKLDISASRVVRRLIRLELEEELKNEKIYEHTEGGIRVTVTKVSDIKGKI